MAGKYTIAAIPTRYGGVLFRSRLEARYAALFDLAGWEWEYEPLDLRGWIPDFLVRIPCGHSECGPHHTLLCEVKPYLTLAEFEGHKCKLYPYGGWDDTDQIPADASAAFGYHPRVSWWEMSHGAGGGAERIGNWVYHNGRSVTDEELDSIWARAGEAVMYRKP